MFYAITSLAQAKVISSLIEWEDLPQPEIDALVAGLLEEYLDAPNRQLFGMKDAEGSVVAYGQLIFNNADNDPTFANGKDIAHMHNLRVRLDARRQGIASQMMAMLEAKARERQVKTLTLGVDGDNPGAILLYKHLGYTLLKEEVGRTPDEKVFYLQKSLG